MIMTDQTTYRSMTEEEQNTVAEGTLVYRSERGHRQVITGFICIEYTHTNEDGVQQFRLAGVTPKAEYAVQWTSFQPDAKVVNVRQVDSMQHLSA